MTIEKYSIQQKVLYGLIFAVVGSLVKYLFNYFGDREFNLTAFVLSFMVFWILGFFLVKKRKIK